MEQTEKSTYQVSKDTAKWIDLKRDLELYRDRLTEMYEETFVNFTVEDGEFNEAFSTLHELVNRGIIYSIDGNMSVSLEDKTI